MPINERRALENVSLRAASVGRKLTGIAAPYNSRTTIKDSRLGQSYDEIIAPGAFRSILATNPDVILTFNHNDQAIPMGRTTSGTLRLSESREGLAFECDLPDTDIANQLHAAVKRGDLSACSFAFSANKQDSDWSNEERDGQSTVLRTLKSFSGLFDISIVTRPAYPNGTSVQARGVAIQDDTERKLVITSAADGTLIWDPNEEVAYLIQHPEAARYLNRIKRRQQKQKEEQQRVVIARRKAVVNSILNS